METAANFKLCQDEYADIVQGECQELINQLPKMCVKANYIINCQFFFQEFAETALS